ncbi:MAG: hypothetical protein ACJ72Y_07600 [Actinomycetes bacterium]
MTEQSEPQPEDATGTSGAFAPPGGDVRSEQGSAPVFGAGVSDAGAPTVAIPWGAHAAAPASVTESSAVVALVCSILSWVALPVVLAIVALVLAHGAERQIVASGGAKSGQTLVTASRWIAWINLLVAAMVVAFAAAFVIAVAIAR